MKKLILNVLVLLIFASILSAQIQDRDPLALLLDLDVRQFNAQNPSDLLALYDNPLTLANLNISAVEVLAMPPPVKVNVKVCSEQKMKEIRAAATPSKPIVKIDCSLTLKPTDVITKRLIFEGVKATGVTCNCNGATLDGGKGKVNYKKDMMEVRSQKTGTSTWQRPENVTIKKCNVIGSVRIWGMGKNGEAAAIKASSKRERTNSRHVQRVRNNAPKNIVLDKVTITGISRNPLYFAPGVTYCKLINSEMKGKSSKVGIYLDAESAYNIIRNNYIHVRTAKDDWGRIPGITNRGWPQVALDGSSRNKIINNRFSALNNGGIYLYRNCGEGGTIRHTPPERNHIINNSFYYKNYKGDKPAIYIGSRDYGFKENKIGHCDLDEGRPYGSSKSDKDYARYNVLMQNQFFKRKITRRKFFTENAKLSDMIKTKNKSLNSPNYIAHNQLVSKRINQKAGAYVANGYKNFLFHGQSLDVYKKNGRLVCGTKLTANDGKLVRSSSNCSIKELPFGCAINGNNKGCSKTVAVPRGKKIIGVKIACNLEFGKVTNSQLASVPINQMKVVKTSDNISDGTCFIESNKIKKGAKTLYDIQDQIRVVIGCKEKDKNGGDCHVKGILYYR